MYRQYSGTVFLRRPGYGIPFLVGIDESVSQSVRGRSLFRFHSHFGKHDDRSMYQQSTCSGAVGSAVVSGALLKTYGSQLLIRYEYNTHL